MSISKLGLNFKSTQIEAEMKIFSSYPATHPIGEVRGNTRLNQGPFTMELNSVLDLVEGQGYKQYKIRNEPGSWIKFQL